MAPGFADGGRTACAVGRRADPPSLAVSQTRGKAPQDASVSRSNACDRRQVRAPVAWLRCSPAGCVLDKAGPAETFRAQLFLGGQLVAELDGLAPNRRIRQNSALAALLLSGDSGCRPMVRATPAGIISTGDALDSLPVLLPSAFHCSPHSLSRVGRHQPVLSSTSHPRMRSRRIDSIACRLGRTRTADSRRT